MSSVDLSACLQLLVGYCNSNPTYFGSAVHVLNAEGGCGVGLLDCECNATYMHIIVLTVTGLRVLRNT